MKNKQVTKRSLVATVLAMVLCVAMLVASTFAWFTDSASNKGNTIIVGDYGVEVIGYEVADDGAGDGAGDLEVKGAVNFKTSSAPLITETAWRPGLTGTRYIMIENTGDLELKYDASVAFSDSGAAMWYCFSLIDGTAADTGAVEAAELADGNDVAKDGLVGANGVLVADEVVWYRLDYGMKSGADIEFAGKSITAGIYILTTQIDDWANYWNTPEGMITPDVMRGMMTGFGDEIDEGYADVTPEGLRIATDAVAGGPYIRLRDQLNCGDAMPANGFEASVRIKLDSAKQHAFQIDITLPERDGSWQTETPVSFGPSSEPGKMSVTVDGLSGSLNLDEGWYTLVYRCYEDAGYLAMKISMLDEDGVSLYDWLVDATNFPHMNGAPVYWNNVKPSAFWFKVWNDTELIINGMTLDELSE